MLARSRTRLSLLAPFATVLAVLLANPALVTARRGEQDGVTPSLSCHGLVVTQPGTTGNDTLVGSPGDDVIAGLGGNDVIDGRGGHDRICGGDGNDSIRGSSGDDQLDGGPGNDTFRPGAGNDRVLGYFGTDTVTFAASPAPVVVSLASLLGTATGEGSDTLFAVENVTGSAFADRLRGGYGRNVFAGLAGNDAVWAGPGDDVLKGGAGNDTLRGGDGNDTFDGGLGVDACLQGTGSGTKVGCER